MNDNFSRGAQLALQAFGIKNERQKQALMAQLYQSQMMTEAMQRTGLGQTQQLNALKISAAEE